MRNLIFILLLLPGCGQINTPNEKIVTIAEDFKPKTLFEQTYPDNLTNVNYYELIPKQIRENIPFQAEFWFNARKVRDQKIKALITEDCDFGFPREGRLEFDKFGNLLYEKRYYASKAYYHRYYFDKLGRIVKKFEFYEHGGLAKVLQFHYNKKDQIDFVRSQGEMKIGIDTLIYVDTTLLEYDGKGNMIKVGEKTFKYDKKGNCIEWKLNPKGGYCGNTTTHWEGKYDDEGNLIDSWSNTNALHSMRGSMLHQYSYDSLFSDDGRLLLLEMYRDDELIEKKYYEYH